MAILQNFPRHLHCLGKDVGIIGFGQDTQSRRAAASGHRDLATDEHAGQPKVVLEPLGQSQALVMAGEVDIDQRQIGRAVPHQAPGLVDIVGGSHHFMTRILEGAGGSHRDKRIIFHYKDPHFVLFQLYGYLKPATGTYVPSSALSPLPGSGEGCCCRCASGTQRKPERCPSRSRGDGGEIPSAFARIIRRCKMAEGSQTANKPFLSDVKTLRDRARKNIAKGAVTATYKGDPKKTVDILQSVLATEIVCVLRYTMHAVTATGIASEAVKAEFAQHAKEEQEHMMAVAERITQLGGEPNFNPEGLASRSASEYKGGPGLVDMITENLVAERIAIDHYRELIRYFGEDDPATKRMLEWILSVEEEHANDMGDLLAAHGGSPA